MSILELTSYYRTESVIYHEKFLKNKNKGDFNMKKFQSCIKHNDKRILTRVKFDKKVLSIKNEIQNIQRMEDNILMREVMVNVFKRIIKECERKSQQVKKEIEDMFVLAKEYARKAAAFYEKADRYVLIRDVLYAKLENLNSEN